MKKSRIDDASGSSRMIVVAVLLSKRGMLYPSITHAATTSQPDEAPRCNRGGRSQ